jgi:hypothetical protein
MSREMARKFRDAVMNEDLNATLRSVKQADITPQEQEEVIRAIMVGKWQSWSSSKDMKPAGKMANAWMVKTLGRGMLPKTQEDENVQFTPRMANAYAKVLEQQNAMEATATSPLGALRRTKLAGSTSQLLGPKTPQKSNSSVQLLRSNSAKKLDGSPLGSDSRSKDTNAQSAEMSALKTELQAARAKADEEAARAKSVQGEMDAMRQQLAQLQQAVPQPESSGGGAGGGAVAGAGPGAGAAPSREEFIKMLEGSPLAEKLSEVETLLRTLISQKARA